MSMVIILLLSQRFYLDFSYLAGFFKLATCLINAGAGDINSINLFDELHNQSFFYH